MRETAPAADATLDAGVTSCGDLVLLMVRQMRAMNAGQVLHVVAYDRGALEDLPAWCRMTNNPLRHQVVSKDSAKPLHFYIQKG
ncbi:MAG: sulfurtransferase TusA family protein [Chloroflexi bacterium]|nr:sulfurtransferase TusA family protein [Chloroflexota bacterium]